MYDEIEVICKKGGDVFQVFNRGEVFFLGMKLLQRVI
jgi:hypothetical protein